MFVRVCFLIYDIIEYVYHSACDKKFSVSLVTRCAFDVHLAVGTTPRPTKHGFSGIPVRFLSLYRSNFNG